MPAAYSPVPDIVATPLESELILLDPRSGEMFSLNETGQFVWERLDSSDVPGIASAVATAFDLSRERAEADVRSLLAELLDAGLVHPQR